MNKYNLYIMYSGQRTVRPTWRGTVKATSSKLYFIHKGRFFLKSDDGKLYILEEGNSYLVPSGLSYDYWCDEEMDHSYFHIALSAFDRIDVLAEIKAPISCKFENFPQNPLSYDTPRDSLYYEAFLSSKIYKLLAENNIQLPSRAYTKEVGLAIEYIKNNLSAQIGTDEVAANSFSAKSTITRAFRKEVGMSIGEYIDSLLFAKATEFLIFHNISIGEISDKLGFGDRFYFSRRFSQKFGCSPNEYRKKNREI